MGKGGITGFVRDEGIYSCEHCLVTLPLDPEAMLNHVCAPQPKASRREVGLSLARWHFGIAWIEIKKAFGQLTRPHYEGGGKEIA